MTRGNEMNLEKEKKWERCLIKIMLIVCKVLLPELNARKLKVYKKWTHRSLDRFLYVIFSLLLNLLQTGNIF